MSIEEFLLKNGWELVPFKKVHPETLCGLKSFEEYKHIVYGKGNIWIDISKGEEYTVVIDDITKAIFCNQGYFGWVGRNQIARFKKEPSIEFLRLTLAHHEI